MREVHCPKSQPLNMDCSLVSMFRSSHVIAVPVATEQNSRKIGEKHGMWLAEVLWEICDPNPAGLTLGWMDGWKTAIGFVEADFRNQILVGKLLSRPIRFTYFRTSTIATFQQHFVNPFFHFQFVEMQNMLLVKFTAIFRWLKWTLLALSHIF